MSDRVTKDLRAELKAARESRLRSVEASKRRAASANRRRGASGDGADAADAAAADQAFALGLSECCPRCGESFLEVRDEEAQRRHLRECTDVKAHKVHKEKKRKRAEATGAAEARADLQEEAETMATFQLLGSKQENLWLLTDSQLRNEAEEVGAVAPGGDGKSKDELIAALVTHRSSS